MGSPQMEFMSKEGPSDTVGVDSNACACPLHGTRTTRDQSTQTECYDIAMAYMSGYQMPLDEDSVAWGFSELSRSVSWISWWRSGVADWKAELQSLLDAFRGGWMGLLKFLLWRVFRLCVAIVRWIGPMLWERMLEMSFYMLLGTLMFAVGAVVLAVMFVFTFLRLSRDVVTGGWRRWDIVTGKFRWTSLMSTGVANDPGDETDDEDTPSFDENNNNNDDEEQAAYLPRIT